MDVLLDHAWPGNVRELMSTVSFALIKSQGRRIEPAHLPPEIRGREASRPARARRRSKLDRESVRQALERAGGSKVAAARILGVGRATLYRFLADEPL
jgi:transcriptional regulator of acetoin/glycerol metabolism